ncbi:MAG TPA: hypothetical protein VHR72_14485, partial [Gemmataceae bacterium]|nr:hypothetical protein [Gemmataceae bacterium]
MYPHRIRLRGPWEVIALDGRTRTVKFPIRWSDLGGATVARRSFGAPSRIDAHERVWLIGEGIAGRLEASLNDRPL